MKIVAYVDALGFRERITSIKHEEAKEVIKCFNSEIFRLWQSYNYNHGRKIHGQTFSDSLIIYTDDDSNHSLEKVLSFLRELYKTSITKCDLPLRGGISIGDFDRIPSTDLKNLRKELVIGTAFIEAYLLESKIKGSKLVFKHDIHRTIEQNLPRFLSKELVRIENGELLYELVWGDIEFLTMWDYEALNKFIQLASKSKWIDHYYHTLETFLTKESQKEKHHIFYKILDTLKSNYRYHDTDNFIENFMKTDGIKNLKKSFLSYLRSGLNI